MFLNNRSSSVLARPTQQRKHGNITAPAQARQAATKTPGIINFGVQLNNDGSVKQIHVFQYSIELENKIRAQLHELIANNPKLQAFIANTGNDTERFAGGSLIEGKGCSIQFDENHDGTLFKTPDHQSPSTTPRHLGSKTLA